MRSAATTEHMKDTESTEQLTMMREARRTHDGIRAFSAIIWQDMARNIYGNRTVASRSSPLLAALVMNRGIRRCLYT